MKKVKLENKLEEEQENNKKKTIKKNPMVSALTKRWVNIMRKNHLKFTQKKKDNYGEVLDLLTQTMKTLKKKTNESTNNDS